MTGTDYARLLGSSPYSAHKALFDEYCNYVYTVVRGRLSSAAREDVEECVSDVFASLYSELEKGGYTGDLRGIVGVVAKRRAIDRYRSVSARRLHFVPLEDDSIMRLPGDADLEKDAENAELLSALLDAVESLGEPDATIVMQRCYFGCTSGEIGKRLSMSGAAVRMRCSRALRRLKKILTDNGFDID